MNHSTPEIKIERDSVYIERVKRDTLPGDTIYIDANIRCDSLLNASLELNELLADENISLKISLDSLGKLSIRATTPGKEIEKTTVETTKNDNIKETIIKEVERKESVFEKILKYSGVFLWCMIFGFIFYKIIMLRQ